MWIASSSEGLQIATTLQDILIDEVLGRIWKYGNFPPTGLVVDDIRSELKHYDFGAFILSPDDTAVIREQTVTVARDNVLLELGMFLGVLGRSRCFVVAPSDIEDLHLPSDLVGPTLVTYEEADARRDRYAAITSVATRIRGRIDVLGAIPRTAVGAPSTSTAATAVVSSAGLQSDSELAPITAETVGEFIADSTVVRRYDRKCATGRGHGISGTPDSAYRAIARRLTLAGLASIQEVEQAIERHQDDWDCFIQKYNDRDRVKRRPVYSGTSLELLAEFLVATEAPMSLARFYQDAGIAGNEQAAKTTESRMRAEVLGPCELAANSAKTQVRSRKSREGDVK